MNKYNSGVNRRHFLAALALSPLWGSSLVRAATAPHITPSHPDLKRIAVLEWLPADLLMALGVIPLAVADIHNYNLWVQQPALPSGVIDLGTRAEPNMELLQQLAPSLILYTQNYGPSIEKMSSIAPIMGFSLKDPHQTQLTLAFNSLKRLAERLELNHQYDLHLRYFQQQIEQSQQRLRSWKNVPILLFTLLNNDNVMVFGKGSIFQDVMDKLGLQNAWQGKVNAFGNQTIGIEQLATIRDAKAIAFTPDNDTLLARMQRTPLWQSFPFVQRYPVSVQPAVWLYGATLSALRFCQLLTAALENRS
ncbi:MAG: Fe(3+)-hydroxamate ABC transporter substrate-binding protein FhuD [Enterobacteriaceae bacterium]|jgi:iron complex transport system substrate-binding protein|nr:Fe(3+)-hydroxamate ABC transporter substrate-binding protein FhuD [Enterobacteriaceae bacterium]